MSVMSHIQKTINAFNFMTMVGTLIQRARLFNVITQFLAPKIISHVYGIYICVEMQHSIPATRPKLKQKQQQSCQNTFITFFSRHFPI